MTAEIMVLTLSSAVIAFVHTLLGPDHYLPFVAMAKARGWGLRKALKVTFACGLGHLAGSILLGLAGIALGIQLSSLEWLEGIRGDLAAWLLIGFGLAYLGWGISEAYRRRPHTHWHTHGGVVHEHEHSHRDDHAHVHESQGRKRSLTPWMIFVIFVLGPCEPLIPLLMYPAALESLTGVLLVTSVFGLVTLMTMIGVVAITLRGLVGLSLGRFQRYGHALAGSAVLACGLAVVFLGL